MANLPAVAIQRAVRSVLVGGHGSSRTIASGTYKGGLYDDLSESGQTLAGLGKPAVSVRVFPVGRHEGSPMVKGNIHLIDVRVLVRVVRALKPKHKLNDDTRDQLYGAAALDADVIQQALEYPNNLDQDADGNATGLVTGYLRWSASGEPDIVAEEGEPGRIDVTHTFSGIVQVSP